MLLIETTVFPRSSEAHCTYQTDPRFFFIGAYFHGRTEAV